MSMSDGELLKSVPLFAHLEEKEINLLLKAAEKRKFRKNRVIFLEDEFGDVFFLIISGKIDHPGFVVSITGFIGIIVLLVLFGSLEIATTSIYIIPFAFIGCYADEIGHETMSSRQRPRALKLFFEHRFALKIAAVICTLLGFAGLIHLIAFFCFDIAYDITARLMTCKACLRG